MPAMITTVAFDACTGECFGTHLGKIVDQNLSLAQQTLENQNFL